MGLTDTDRRLQDLTGRTWTVPGSLEQAMTEATGMSPWRAWQRLNVLADKREAWEYAPLTCRQLQSRRGRGSTSAA